MANASNMTHKKGKEVITGHACVMMRTAYDGVVVLTVVMWW